MATGFTVVRHLLFSLALSVYCVVVEFTGDYAFLGALIIKEVVKELLAKGLDKAEVLILTGSRSESSSALSHTVRVNRIIFHLCSSEPTVVVLLQCGRHRRLGKRGPCCRAVADSRSLGSAGQRSH